MTALTQPLAESSERPTSSPLWFEANREQQDILESLRDFLKSEVAPGAATRDQTHEFPHGLVQKLGAMGVMGAQTPEMYGGSALETATFARIIEEIANVDGSLALTVASHNSLCSGHILVAGTPTQKQEFLPDLAVPNASARGA